MFPFGPFLNIVAFFGYLYIYYYRKPLAEAIKKRKERLHSDLVYASRFFRFRLDKYIIVAFMIFIVEAFLFHKAFGFQGNANVGRVMHLYQIVIGPFGEEFLYRGLILGLFPVLPFLMRKEFNVDEGKINNLRYMIWLTLSALAFSMDHTKTPFLHYRIFIHGIISGFLYLKSKYNIAPSFTFHFLNNITTTLINL